MPFYQSSEHDEPQPPPSPPRDPRWREQRRPLLPGEDGLQRTPAAVPFYQSSEHDEPQPPPSPPRDPRWREQRRPLLPGEDGLRLAPAPEIKPEETKHRWLANLTGRFTTGHPMIDGIGLAINMGWQAEGFLIHQALRIEPLQDLLGIEEIESLSPEALGGESMTVITGQDSGLNLIDTFVNFINRQGEPGGNKAISTGLPFLDVLVSGTADEDLLTHEAIHVDKQRQEGLVPWLIRYSLRLAVDTAKYGSLRAAYEQNPDEIEANTAVNPKYKPPPAPPFWWRTEARRQARERLLRQMLDTSPPRGP